MTAKKHPAGPETETAAEEAPAGAPAAETQAPEPAADEVDALQKALAEAEDRHVRLYAEFENYKKRTGREAEEFRRYANEKVLKEMLPVLDNLERALVHVREAPEEGLDKLTEGVELIRKQFADVLGRFDVTPIPAAGRPFDPSVHQAVSQQETADAPDGTVLTELQRGFYYKERVLRPAMVVVAKGTTDDAAK